MPEKRTLAKARAAKRQGKKATTQAGAFVGEEMRHAKRGKHPVKSRKQAIAIGLSKARRAGVKVPKKKAGGTRGGRKTATRSPAAGKTTARKPAARRTTRKAPARRTASRSKKRG